MLSTMVHEAIWSTGAFSILVVICTIPLECTDLVENLVLELDDLGSWTRTQRQSQCQSRSQRRCRCDGRASKWYEECALAPSLL